MVFLKTALFLCFLLLTGPLSAQENAIPVKIESPTSSFVSRSFTISGSAQAGAKLHLTINGKTFGRYRATIEGKFTIGVSVPEDKLFIEIAHLVDGVIQSSDSIRLEVGAEHDLKKIEEAKEKTKNEVVNEQTETTESKRNLPSAGRIPTKPGVLKKQYTDEPNVLATEAGEKDPVVLGTKNTRYFPTKTDRSQNDNTSIGGRIALEALGGVAVTVGMIAVTIFLVELEQGPSSELLLSLFAAELALAPMGVYFGGNLAGGKADLWPIYIGELFGLAGSVGFIFAGNSAGSGAQEVLGILALASPFVGMITAYEISHAMNVKKFSTFSMQPTIRINKDVKSLGLQLRF